MKSQKSMLPMKNGSNWGAVYFEQILAIEESDARRECIGVVFSRREALV